VIILPMPPETSGGLLSAVDSGAMIQWLLWDDDGSDNGGDGGG